MFHLFGFEKCFQVIYDECHSRDRLPDRRTLICRMYMYISGQLWQNICVPKMPILSLPEHPSASVGQSLFSCDNPKQSSPPFAGGGLVQVRVRVLNPWRQRVGSVHVVQAVQVVNTPSTAPAKKKKIVRRALTMFANNAMISICFLSKFSPDINLLG